MPDRNACCSSTDAAETSRQEQAERGDLREKTMSTFIGAWHELVSFLEAARVKNGAGGAVVAE